MERKEFLSKLGIGLAAVCAGCSFASCGSTPKSENPAPDNGNNNNPGGGTNLFTVNLSTDLKNTGEFKIASGVILVRLAAANVSASFSAVQVACTHQGTGINWNTAQGKYICPNHGSEFSTTGSVLLGPATTALKQYNVNIEGSTLTVSA